MVKEDIVHVKYEFDEAVYDKKDILQAKAINLYMLRSLRNYTQLRQEELKLKAKLRQKLLEFEKSLALLKEKLPSSQLPKSIRKKEENIKKEAREKQERSKDIEDELDIIQKQLQHLQKLR